MELQLEQQINGVKAKAQTDVMAKESREIKFRAWNIVTKSMIDLKKITPLALNMDTDGLFLPFSDGLPLMQYTGLKDKNGKEIYEGDILVIPKRKVFDPIDLDTNEIINVCFQFGAFVIGNEICFSDGLYDYNEYSEIIGNVFENPELLK